MNTGRPFSLILLPTLDCNAACDYCFEEKSSSILSREDLPRLTASVLDYMQSIGAVQAEVYWQGGEALLLGPEWYASAHDVMGAAAAARGLSFKHYLQTNLIGFGPQWNEVIRNMFDGSIGTSMDFPNDHRRLRNGSTQEYTEQWLKSVIEAQEAGFEVGVISVLHSGSLGLVPDQFLNFFTEQAKLKNLQVNLPFPGGPAGVGAEVLDTVSISRFLLGLLDAWIANGYFDRGIRLAPFEALLDIYSGRPGRLPCIWLPNCASDFVSIDPRGNVAQCDCWVTSYPRHLFGNLFAASDLTQILAGSPARRAFLDRPAQLMDLEDCDTCTHLALCHGGCPVRTFASRQTMQAKDPYCEVYKAVFEKCRQLAGKIVTRRLPEKA